MFASLFVIFIYFFWRTNIITLYNKIELSAWNLCFVLAPKKGIFNTLSDSQWKSYSILFKQLSAHFLQELNPVFLWLTLCILLSVVPDTYGTQLSETGEGNGRNRFQNAGKFTLIESKYFCADCQFFFKRLDLKYANDFI